MLTHTPYVKARYWLADALASKINSTTQYLPKPIIPEGFGGDNYITSNENFGVQNIHEQLLQYGLQKNELLSVHKPLLQIGLIIGESHILEILPELASFLDLIIFIDINPHCHEHIKIQLDCLSYSKNYEIFRANYYNQFYSYFENNFPYNQRNFKQKSIIADNANIISGIKLCYRLRNRYQNIKAAYERLQYAYVNLDICAPEQLLFLQALLLPHQIAFINLSNIVDYLNLTQRNIFKSTLTTILQNNQQPLFMHSKIVGSFQRQTAIPASLTTCFDDLFDRPIDPIIDEKEA